MNPGRESDLVDVFVQRSFDVSDTRDPERPDSPRLEPCLDLHGIRREHSYLARDGKRILCHFRAPDAESLREALRVAGVDYDALWTGAVRNIAGAPDFMLVVERVFDRPVSLDRERGFRVEAARCLQEAGLQPARVLLSRCRKRILWLCRATRADAITAAEIDLAGLGFQAWSCKPEPPGCPANANGA